MGIKAKQYFFNMKNKYKKLYGIWNSDNNKMIYSEISEIWEDS